MEKMYELLKPLSLPGVDMKPGETKTAEDWEQLGGSDHAYVFLGIDPNYPESNIIKKYPEWFKEVKATVETKDDLRDGDLLILRDGGTKTFKKSGSNDFGFKNYCINDDLTNNGWAGEDYDIMKVIRCGKTVFERE